MDSQMELAFCKSQAFPLIEMQTLMVQYRFYSEEKNREHQSVLFGEPVMTVNEESR